jgi:hypothetical protein
VHLLGCRRTACSSLFNKSDGPRTNSSSTQHQMASPAVYYFFSRNSMLSNGWLTAWALSLRKSQGLWMYENKMLNWILGRRKTGKSRKDDTVRGVPVSSLWLVPGSKVKGDHLYPLSYLHVPRSSFDYTEYVSANCGKLNVYLFLHNL